VTYEEFLRWADEDTLAEWVEGKVILLDPPPWRHQDIAGFLGGIMRPFVEQHDLGIVLGAPFQMRLAHSGREPDLLFLAKGHMDRLQDTYLDGPADLVVEIVSPESIGRDRGHKFYEYEEAGIPEYWLIDPDTERVEFYRLGPHGRYRLVALEEEEQYCSSLLPGFCFETNWLWQDPLPPVLGVLGALGLLGI
jgi:Uma2 family endonuclease